MIVDDEFMARKELRALLAACPQVQVVGEAAHAEEARQLCQALKYDLVFLDIQMPGLSGIDLAKQLLSAETPPRIIFTTAYPEFAVDAFNVGAADYLVKPFDEGRLSRAVARAFSWLASRSAEADSQMAAQKPAGPAAGQIKNLDGLRNRIAIDKWDRTIFLDAGQIIFVYVKDEDVFIKLLNEKILTRHTLREMEEKLEPFGFIRTHRRFLVNPHRVKEVLPYFKGNLSLVVEDDEKTEIPVSRSLAREVKKRLGIIGEED